MKYAVICPDGAADRPLRELKNRTPLEAAEMPNARALAATGIVGLVRHIPKGMDKGSDVACMSLLGYDPSRYHTGRAPLEAKALGVELEPGDIAVRCNLVTVCDGRMEDFSAGHISTDEARVLIEALNARLADGKVRFHAGVSYRHLLVLRGFGRRLDARCVPPHDITGREVTPYLPRGPDAGILLRLMEESARIFETHEVNRVRADLGESQATQIWLWGHGMRPDIPPFRETTGLSCACISAVALVRSLAMYAGIEVLDVPGITGYTDTDYGAKGRYAAEALGRFDMVFVHVEAPDECGHNADVLNKVKSLEAIDRHIIGPLAEAARRHGEHRILVCPDHATPVALRTHSDEPVPFLASGSGIAAAGGQFSENGAKGSGIVYDRGWELLPGLLRGFGRDAGG
ncbi:MAG: cofactor-independent phosphoglycerate mutase [Planctomycetota bacterium]|nr:cofactor-independent phosphoglycerate mutase [Planctomycetota bacterium]